MMKSQLLSSILASALAASLVLAGPAAAREFGSRLGATAASSTTTIPVQVRLASSSGIPVNGLKTLTFSLYTVASGGSALWTETWTAANAVQVTDGIASALLGSRTALPQSIVANNSTLYLGITVDVEAEMLPRVQLGSAPIAMTVPDGSIGTAKININGDLDMHGSAAFNTSAIKAPDRLILYGTQALMQGNQPAGAHMWMTDKDYPAGDGSTDAGSARLHIVKDTSRAFTPFFDIYSLGTDGTSRRAFSVDYSGNTFTAGEMTIGSQGIGEGGQIVLNNGATGSFWAIDNFFGAVRFFRDTGVKFSIDGSGNTVASGSKSAAVGTDDYGTRKLYSVEAADVRFTDEGNSKLAAGVARITLDPVFIQTIVGEYVISVTPYGNAALYVSDIGSGYFEVRSRDGDPNVRFSWRVSAARKGYENVRLEKVDDAQLKP